MAIFCDTLCHAHAELQPIMLQLLQVIVATAPPHDFATHHHPHLVRAMQVASTNHSAHAQAVVVCIKQCIAIKLVELQEEGCTLVQHVEHMSTDTSQHASSADQQGIDDDDDDGESDSDEIMFDIEL